MFIYVACFVHTLPIISKPLDKNPDHLVWEALLTIDNHRLDDKTRKIPKSIFITPNLGTCPPDHKLGADGKCYKTLKIDPVDLLKSQIAFLFKKNKTATTEYVEDYDYSEYGESTEAINSSSNSGYTLPLSLSFPSEDTSSPAQHTTAFTHLSQLNRVVKDGTHGINNNTTNNANANKPFLSSAAGFDLDPEKISPEFEAIRSQGSASTAASIATPLIPLEATKDAGVATTLTDDVTETLELELMAKTHTTDDETHMPVTEQTVSQSESSTTSDSVNLSILDHTETIDSIRIPAISSTPDNSVDASSNAATFKPITTTPSTPVTPTTTLLSTRSDKLFSPPLSFSAVTLNDEGGPTTTAAQTTTPITESVKTTSTSSATAIIVLPASSTPPAATVEITTVLSPITVTKGATTDVKSTSTETTPNTSTLPSALVESTVRRAALEPMPTDEIITDYEDPKFPVLSQIGEIDKILMDLSENVSKILESFEQSDSDEMTKQQDDEFATETNQAPTTTQSQSPGVVVVLPENATVDDARISNDQGNVDIIDAYYVPSPSKQLYDRIDDASIEPAIESKYRLENVSVVSDDEWPSDAPFMANKANAQSDIELVRPTSSAEHLFDNEDETTNLTARLAEDFLIRGPSMELASVNEMVKNASAANASGNESSKSLELDEALRYPFDGSNDEVTTMEPIEPPTDLIIVHSKKAQNGGRSNIFLNNTMVEIKHAVRMGTDSTGQPAQRVNSKASVYSTFLNRLKPMPPFVQLQLPDAIRRQSFVDPMAAGTIESHTDIQTEAVDESTDGQFIMADEPSQADPDGHVEQPLIDGKPSQLGINCYLRPLVNKQYFIYCK